MIRIGLVRLPKSLNVEVKLKMSTPEMPVIITL